MWSVKYFPVEQVASEVLSSVRTSTVLYRKELRHRTVREDVIMQSLARHIILWVNSLTSILVLILQA